MTEPSPLSPSESPSESSSEPPTEPSTESPSPLSALRAWIRENPWIWIVLLFVLFIAADMVFVKIAMDLPLEEIGP